MTCESDLCRWGQLQQQSRSRHEALVESLQLLQFLSSSYQVPFLSIGDTRSPSIQINDQLDFMWITASIRESAALFVSSSSSASFTRQTLRTRMFSRCLCG